ncbi:hypothetical protein [Streptomyces sp. NPDC097619]|uniref:hypothetical protein n=1 Tax=Streptomyces sp. NPDC097619 TaxID=3157228 RepID=UPI00332AAAAA
MPDEQRTEDVRTSRAGRLRARPAPAEPPAAAGTAPADGIVSAEPADGEQETAAQRRQRRAQFLRDLNEARELRERVQPRRARAARMRQQMRMRTFRW